MQIANCRVIIDDRGSDVHKQGVTPAQVQILIHQFHTIAGKLPVVDLKITGEVVRSAGEELLRLQQLYKMKLVNILYPGAHPSFPQTFAELEFQAQFPYDPKKSAPPIVTQPLAQESLVMGGADGIIDKTGKFTPVSLPPPPKVTLPTPLGQFVDPLLTKSVAVIAPPAPTPLAETPVAPSVPAPKPTP